MSRSTFTQIKPVVVEAVHLHTSSFIFLHETGSNGRDWRYVLTQMKPIHTRLICPTAPLGSKDKTKKTPLHSWYELMPIRSYYPEDEAGIKAASHYVHSLIEQEIASGIPPNRILLAGFSEGAALALYAALTYHRPLAGIIMISGYLPLRNSFPSSLFNSNKMPIYHFHGEKDETIKFEHGLLSYALLRGFMENVDMKAYPNVVECTTPDILRDVHARVLEILG